MSLLTRSAGRIVRPVRLARIVVALPDDAPHHQAARRWADALACREGARLSALCGPRSASRCGGSALTGPDALLVVGTPGPASVAGRPADPFVAALVAAHDGPVAVVPGLYRTTPDGPVLSTTLALPASLGWLPGSRPLVRAGSFAELIRASAHASLVVLSCGPHRRPPQGDRCPALTTLGSVCTPAIVVHPTVAAGEAHGSMSPVRIA